MTVLNAVQHCTLDKIAWGLHGLAVIRWTPRAAVYGCVHIVVIKCGCLIDIRDGTGENTDSRDFGIVCNTDTTDVIFDIADLAGTMGAMVVVRKLWLWEGFMAIEIIRAGCPLRNTGTQAHVWRQEAVWGLTKLSMRSLLS